MIDDNDDDDDDNFAVALQRGNAVFFLATFANSER